MKKRRRVKDSARIYGLKRNKARSNPTDKILIRKKRNKNNECENDKID
jgi:hypothetical protein